MSEKVNEKEVVKLKECPFCKKNDAEVVSTIEVNDKPLEGYILCNFCEAQGPYAGGMTTGNFAFGADPGDEIIRLASHAWNNRS